MRLARRVFRPAPNKRFVAQPQSGEMFIAHRARNDWQLRRSVMFSSVAPMNGLTNTMSRQVL
jgi:hypothetical protein